MLFSFFSPFFWYVALKQLTQYSLSCNLNERFPVHAPEFTGGRITVVEL